MCPLTACTDRGEHMHGKMYRIAHNVSVLAVHTFYFYLFFLVLVFFFFLSSYTQIAEGVGFVCF